MSGVIDERGQQWEHCNGCGKFVKFPQNLGYERPTKRWPHGRDLCVVCVDREIRAGEIDFELVVPAPSWKITEEEL